MREKKQGRAPLSADELEAQHGSELPDREALSVVFGPAPASLLPAVHAAAQSAVAANAEDVAASAAPDA
jgi:hypothetical protein